MKAIQFSKFGGRDVLEYVEVSKPVPQRDELLIEVTASGVNFVDIRERMGVLRAARNACGTGQTPASYLWAAGCRTCGRCRSIGRPWLDWQEGHGAAIRGSDAQFAVGAGCSVKDKSALLLGLPRDTASILVMFYVMGRSLPADSPCRTGLKAISDRSLAKASFDSSPL
jgi:NADPH:quinone reductase-like Zn-dependent oxidoreductase